MTTVLLNSNDHGNLRIDASYRASLGDAVMWVPTYSEEFRSIQAHYPILFNKDEKTGQFSSVALLGLEANENLFLQDGSWQASYIPLMIQRVPFSIGRYFDEEEERRLVHIDPDHPKVSTDEGQRLFESHGASTQYLERISAMLETIHQWVQRDIGFIKALEELELLEPVSIDITLENGTTGQLMGFYTINETALAEISSEALYSLQKHRYLEPIYMAIASLANIRRLMELKASKSDTAEA